jgi:putative ABC transport system ATP-binding protein
MLKIEKLTKIYHRGQPDEIHALSELDLILDTGSFSVIIGANGSGKSTLLHALLGTVKPTSGKIMLDDNRIDEIPAYMRSRWISMVFQDPTKGTAPELTVLENFRLASLRTQKKGLSIGMNRFFREDTAEKIKKLGMGLENKLDLPMGNLSGGQRQALTLLMSVMDDTKLLLMDEPTAALDPKSAHNIMELADQIHREMGISILLITHQMKEALDYGNQLLFFKQGRVHEVVSGENKNTLTLSDLQRWFIA